MNKLAIIGIGVVLGLALTLGAWFIVDQNYTYQGVVIDPPARAPDFTLSDQNGNAFRLSDQRGKTVLLFFGYTNCPDVCPTTMANLRQALTQLGSKDVQVIFITVDPGRDTPEKVQAYASQFDPSFIGLSGSMAELEPVWTAYGVYRELGPADANGNYDVSHTARVTVIDPKGDLRLSINTDATWQDIVHDLRLLLKEG